MRDLPRAFSGAVPSGRFRETADDFVVVEQLKEAPSETGEHSLVEIEKRGQNTQWVARWLARESGCAARDVGYCGLKDRHARTRQWFSVPVQLSAESLAPPDGVGVLQVRRHHRKLRLGAHAANVFRLRLNLQSGAEYLQARCDQINQFGCPNWFGSQRFGRGGANLDNALRWFRDGGRVRREQRSFLLSAARSAVFNRYLAMRVGEGSWASALPGDVLNLAGSGSVFWVESVDEETAQRVTDLDLHPTGPLWGRGEAVRGSGRAALERALLTEDQVLLDGLEKHGLAAERRALRMYPSGLSLSVASDEPHVTVAFSLPPGQFATAVLHELGDFVDGVDAS